ncbi:hypothetical protein [Comamonas serinivorans]|nr:hypothetical protein [Comamonas serinivorans]
MRRLVSLALVCLLVLRGLLGDAMAMGGVATMDTPVVPTAGSASLASHAGHGPASLHGADTPTVAPDATAHCASEAPHDGDGAGHTHCTLCAVCHSPLAQPHTLVLGLPMAADRHALQRTSRFVSAALPPITKPPIS